MTMFVCLSWPVPKNFTNAENQQQILKKYDKTYDIFLFRELT